MRPNTDMKTTRVLTAVLLGVVLFGSIIDCSHSTKPKEVKYNIYAGVYGYRDSTAQSEYHQINVYDADSLTLLDSISRPNLIDYLALSPDGRWLYLRDRPSAYDPATLWQMDARTGHVVWSSKQSGWPLRFLAGGELLLAGNTLLRTTDNAILRDFGDTLHLEWGPITGTKVAVTVGEPQPGSTGNPVVKVIDVMTGEVSGEYIPRLSSGQILEEIRFARLHPDGRRILAIGLYGSIDNSWFVIGDVQTGQTLFEYHIYRPHGEVVTSDDGNTAVMTDPGTTGFGEIGTAHVIDLVGMRRIGPTVPIEPVGPLRTIPGTSKIVAASSADGWSSVWLQVFDLKTMTVERTLRPPWEPTLTALDVGRRP